ncbi:methionine aminotransferase [Uliginosibacterium aquaticum]|uniref:Aminotransferase class I/II-fold pyridoxal phosphate-dependent enzyme n=1 Tax=Uliginosibacterium aquaticum TaxID=2731212 RepID=A0ABX2IKW9_9RHOO|nr:methionine aminotransferase [Uliginosibacterium aquaticum]NSL54968.1 aminotransferase class I/II-fold pyridoxal phosphate-dependent enzyme [Uliginosibacterium aquaticum]
MPIHSKLPAIGTTIFSVMSTLAAEHGAINLSQGFPDYPCDPALLDALAAAAHAGHNQYAPMAGLPALRAAIAAKLLLQHGTAVDADSEITVAAGATQALFTAIASVLQAGDEAILLDPSYDSYAPSILAQGAKPVHVALMAPDFKVDWEQVEHAVTPRTRLILINNPNNPATSVFSAADLDALAAIAERHDLLVLADEVYEHLIYDGATHQSVLTHPALRARSFAVYSFGKTFHATGWKIGYCVAPPALSAEFRKIHQFLVFAVNTPAQHALAAHLADPASWQGLSAFFAERRALLAPGLESAGFKLLPSQGTYFQLADYSAIRPDLEDVAFARWLTLEHGVASIPVSVFYQQPPAQKIVRFCFAKQTQTLQAASERLARLGT